LPVVELDVRKGEDPLPVPAVGAHHIGETIEAGALANDKVGRVGHEVRHAVDDRELYSSPLAHQ
jgi:hypothetical protein